jgi:hypothetical protein
MGKITLSEGFTVIPEGTHIFKIIEVNYKEQFGKLEIKMKTAKGQTHIERFSLLKADGSTNEGALNAFSYFARAALGDFSAQDIDPEELVGFFVECDVEHDIQPSNKNPEKNVTFVRLADKRHAEGYDEEEVVTPPPAKKKTAAPAPAPTKKTEVKAEDIDLDALLG